MRTSLLLTALLSLACIMPAQAQVYKYKDAKGNTVYSDAPQTGGGTQAPVMRTAPPDNAVEAQKSLAEKEMEFRKRQQEQQESAAKAEKERADAAEKAENCQRAKQLQAMLESGERVARRTADGGRELLDEQQRQQEIARARKSVQDWCKP